MNLNSNPSKMKDTYFKTAVCLYEQDLPHEKLIELLKSNSDINKQIATLKLGEIENENEAQLLIANLTGQDGTVREAVAFKLSEFMNNNKFIKYFQNPQNAHILLCGAVDIQANVCRNTIAAIRNLKNNKEFCNNLATELVKNINELLKNIEKFDLKAGIYKVNKEIFKLYWYLEVFYEFVDFIDKSDIKSILKRTQAVDDYTIREKTAKILSKIPCDSELLTIKDKLKKDENYYVRRY